MGIFQLDFRSQSGCSSRGEDACNNCNIESKIILKSYSSAFLWILLKHLIIFFPFTFPSLGMGMLERGRIRDMRRHHVNSPALSSTLVSSSLVYPFLTLHPF